MNAAGASCPPRDGRWPLERVLFALAGTMTLVSVILVLLVSPWFLVLTSLVGVNQWLYVTFGACPASFVLSRAFKLRSVIYPPANPGISRDRSA